MSRGSRTKEPIRLDSKTEAVMIRKGYKVTDYLAEGAFGKVYKAIDTNDKVLKAVKVIELGKLEKKGDQVILDMLSTEIELLTKLKHPNILQVFDIIRSNHRYYIFMEFAPNGSLDKQCTPDPPPRSKARKWFTQVVDAVRYLHDDMNVAHRDIKLENVLLDEDMNAKLCDFGFAREIDNGTSRTVLGTAPYYSPQLISRKEHSPFKDDSWALGVMLFAMMTAKLPFNQFPKERGADQSVWEEFRKAQKTRWYKNRPQWESLDKDVKDLINRLLEPDERSRLTARQILKHPWCRK